MKMLIRVSELDEANYKAILMIELFGESLEEVLKLCKQLFYQGYYPATYDLWPKNNPSELVICMEKELGERFIEALRERLGFHGIDVKVIRG